MRKNLNIHSTLKFKKHFPNIANNIFISEENLSDENEQEDKDDVIDEKDIKASNKEK